MSKSSDVKLKQNVGLPINRSSACDDTMRCIAYAVSKMACAYLL